MALQQHGAQRADGGVRPAEASTPQQVEEEVRPRGAMAIMLLYLLVVVAAWAYMYLSLVGRW
ncbi:MAG: hypothetical protein AB1609_07920 [Bacillota bacterium]